MKIVWLCNYSLKYLKDKLNFPIDDDSTHPTTWLYYFNLEFQKRKEIDLHIILLSSAIPHDTVIVENNVTYHLIKNSVKRFAEHLPLIYFQKLYHKKESFVVNNYIKPKVLKRINSIQPDLVTLFGTEGEFGTIINEVNFPKVVWILGVLHKVLEFDHNPKFEIRLKNEKEIFTKQTHFITYDNDTDDIIKKYNPNAKFYKHTFPLPEYLFELKKENLEKDADISFVGQIIKRKGVEDLIDAIYLVKKDKPEIKAKIIGFGGGEYLNMIKKKIVDAGLQKNILLMGYISENKDVMYEIKKSRVFVLPTHVDVNPTSVSESMALGVPVVSYNLDGLNILIKNGESGLLVERGDISGLAKAIKELLDNQELANKIVAKAFEFTFENFHPSIIINNILQVYQSIAHYL